MILSLLFQFLTACILAASISATAFAHDHYHGPEENAYGTVAEFFRELAREGLEVHQLNTVADGTESYLELPGGQRFTLDASYWQAVERALKRATIAETQLNNHAAECALSHPENPRFLGELRNHKFWIRLRGNAHDFVAKNGKLIAAAYLLTEIVEHSLPFSIPLCVPINSFYMMYAPQLRFFFKSLAGNTFAQEEWAQRWRVAWSNFVMVHKQSLSNRRMSFTETGSSLSRRRFRKEFVDPSNPLDLLLAQTPYYWPLAVFQFHYPNSSPSPDTASATATASTNASVGETIAKVLMDPSLPGYIRYFAANDQIHFIGLQLKVAKELLLHHADRDPVGYWIARKLLSRNDTSLDRFDHILKWIALNPPRDGITRRVRQEQIAAVMAGFQQTYMRMASWFDQDHPPFSQLTQQLTADQSALEDIIQAVHRPYRLPQLSYACSAVF